MKYCVKYYWRLNLEDLETDIGRGVLIDCGPPDRWAMRDACPHCEQRRWHIAYLDLDWNGNQSSPDDAFECPCCGAVYTRRDACGAWEEQHWDKDDRR